MVSFDGARADLQNARLATIAAALSKLSGDDIAVELGESSTAVLALVGIYMELRKLRGFVELEYNNGFPLEDPGD